VFLASVANAQAGLATIATDVVGHGYGERSQWQITSGGTTTTLPAYGRGVDQDDAGAPSATRRARRRPARRPPSAAGTRCARPSPTS
jgi:hypothetical protein